MDLICDQMGGAYKNQVQFALSVFDTWALCDQTLTKITVVLFFVYFLYLCIYTWLLECPCQLQRFSIAHTVKVIVIPESLVLFEKAKELQSTVAL